MKAGEVRVLERVRDDLHIEAVAAEPGHREADSVHRDRPLGHEIGSERRRKTDGEPHERRLVAPQDERNIDALVAEGTKLSELSMKVANEAIAPIQARVSETVEKLTKSAA